MYRTAIALWLLVSAAGAAEIQFGARPRLTDVTALNSNLLARAAPWRDAPLVVPRESAQWYFYYACPNDNAQLVPESPDRHLCSSCKAVYTDARTVAAYRCLLHNDLDNQLILCGQAYALTHDARYAQRVRDGLRELAALYPEFERHDRWGRTGLLAAVGGRRYAQLLDEATSVINLARAYDLIAEARCLTADDRQVIEQQLLGDIARDLQGHQLFIDRQNNHQTWFNAAYANVGVAIGDSAFVTAALNGDRGLRWQLQHSVTDDGLWYEGTISYHFYALIAIERTLEAARAAGQDLAGDARLKSLWLGPLQATFPDGRFPAINDGDPASLANFGEHYAWARQYFNDPTLTTLTNAPVGSAALRDAGLAVLRGSGTCAMIKFGQHGGAHGHPDKLNLMLYALGQEWLLDPGRISYSVPEFKTWCRTTAAHNTLVIDRHDQRPTTGELWHFQETNGVAAAVCATTGAYPGYLLKRGVVLAGNVLVDVLTVAGKKRTTLDAFVHCRGTWTTDVAFVAQATPLGAANGYQHLTSLARADRSDRLTAKFASTQNGFLRAWFVGDDATDWFAGLGIGATLTEKVPFLLRRRHARQTTFITVYDLSGNGSALTGVEVVAASADAVALRLNTPAGINFVTLDLRRESSSPVTLR